ncbi:hypothetical protein G6F59_015953 [Rhizopus arrhizus]|nr:hypothetical protein G6F59_015953 [Rhizopus arrhizus]
MPASSGRPMPGRPSAPPRQRDQREEDARYPQREYAEEPGACSARQDGKREPCFERQAVALRGQGQRVAAGAQEGGVAEGHHAQQAEYQIEAYGEYRPHHDQDGQVEQKVVLCEKRHRQHCGGNADGNGGILAEDRHANLAWRENSPCGRVRSVAISMANVRISTQLGMKV